MFVVPCVCLFDNEIYVVIPKFEVILYNFIE